MRINPIDCPSMRAYGLLRQVLTPEDLAWMDRTNEVRVRTYLHTYRITAWDQTLVERNMDGKVFLKACVQLLQLVPAYDRVIAEYLLIRSDEKRYWNTANFFPIGPNPRGCLPVPPSSFYRLLHLVGAAVAWVMFLLPCFVFLTLLWLRFGWSK